MTIRIPAIVLALLAGACHKPGAAPSEAEAVRIADATVPAWTSMDAVRIETLHVPNVIGFDHALAPLAADRATRDGSQDAYAAATIDSAAQKRRTIRILGPDVLATSGPWDLKSSTSPANDGAIRCTDVYHKDDAGRWPIVDEHCALAPKPV